VLNVEPRTFGTLELEPWQLGKPGNPGNLS